jgi:hypothetical protein
MSVKPPAAEVRRGTEQIEKVEPVQIVDEERCTGRSARSDVEVAIFELTSRDPRHGSKVSTHRATLDLWRKAGALR